MDEEQGVPCTTANHKSTGTSKPSQAYNVPVQNVCLPAELLLQQYRTSLHRRVLLHGRQ